MQGEGGRGKNMILYYTGEGGGGWRGAKLYYIIIEWPLNGYEDVWLRINKVIGKKLQSKVNL